VRAPRTCPAVRMRHAPAPQGKPSALLRPLLSPAPPERGGARPKTGGPAAGRARGRGHFVLSPALLKGTAPPHRDSFWVVRVSLCRWKTGSEVAVICFRSASSEGQELELRTGRLGLGAGPSEVPHSCTPHLELLAACLFPSGQVPSLTRAT
jgi:hypothetical protein